jgi:hypothetical protein
MRTRLKGTNQYKVQEGRIYGLKISTWKNINTECGLIIIVGYFGHQVAIKDVDLHRHLVSPISMKAYAYDAPQWKQPEMAPIAERQRNIILIRRYFGADSDTAIKVFSCESGLRADAVNPKNDDGYPDIGLAQIHVTSSDPFTIAEMKNPEANLAEAKYKFDHRGWQPWASSNGCHHMWKAGETK